MRRSFLLVACLLLFFNATSIAPVSASDAAIAYPEVQRGKTLTFPGDHGAHPEFRTEWWYVTGWVESEGVERGFQVTFFRTRTGLQEKNESGFSPTQLLFAHAAISDAALGVLRHDQRAARAGFGLVYASVGETMVAVEDWKLIRSNGVYRARIVARDFVLDLRLSPTQPVILQGDAGYSRKGPQRGQASYYYSLPHLQVSGLMEIENETHQVSGEAWLDHEWSSEYLPADAQGWDWASINLSDGGAVMAFRMRSIDGSTLWAGGSVRNANGQLNILSPGDVSFEARKLWRSPRTGADYPIALRVRTGKLVLELDPLMDDQELDSRASTGVIYWEGAVRATRDGEPVGVGYLELTGYAGRPEM